MEAPVSLSETGEIDQGKHGSSTELVVMTVEIGDGRKDVIRIHIGDDPDELAQVFAHKHGLDPHLQQNLALLIRQNKETVEARALPSPEPSKWHHMQLREEVDGFPAIPPVADQARIRDAWERWIKAPTKKLNVTPPAPPAE